MKEIKNSLIINSVMRDNNEIISNLISCGYSRNNIFLLQDLFKKENKSDKTVYFYGIRGNMWLFCNRTTKRKYGI